MSSAILQSRAIFEWCLSAQWQSWLGRSEQLTQRCPLCTEPGSRRGMRQFYPVVSVPTIQVDSSLQGPIIFLETLGCHCLYLRVSVMVRLNILNAIFSRFLTSKGGTLGRRCNFFQLHFPRFKIYQQVGGVAQGQSMCFAYTNSWVHFQDTHTHTHTHSVMPGV